MLRSDRPVTESNKRKIALMCDVDEDAVVNAVDVPSIYDIPTMLHDQNLDEYIVRTLGLEKSGEVDWKDALGKKQISLQATDGSWANTVSGRWMDSSPVLVTAYTVLALEQVHRSLK